MVLTIKKIKACKQKEVVDYRASLGKQLEVTFHLEVKNSSLKSWFLLIQVTFLAQISILNSLYMCIYTLVKVQQ